MESLTHSFTGSSATHSYGYNRASQLIDVNVTDSSFVWIPSASSDIPYGTADSVNKYPSVDSVSLSYDSNKNLTGDGTWTFGYDTENHLLTASKTGTSASFVYDPMHRQSQKTVDSTKSRYIYSGWQRIADYDGSPGTLQNRYVYGTGLDEPLITVSSGGTLTFLHQDRIGSVIATSDDTGALSPNINLYSPFGEISTLSGTTFGFTGQRYDSELGLYYFKHRYYSPKLGRFLQPDPGGYSDGLNLYSYANNDALNLVDRLGLASSGNIWGNNQWGGGEGWGGNQWGGNNHVGYDAGATTDVRMPNGIIVVVDTETGVVIGVRTGNAKDPVNIDLSRRQQSSGYQATVETKVTGKVLDKPQRQPPISGNTFDDVFSDDMSNSQWGRPKGPHSIKFQPTDPLMPGNTSLQTYTVQPGDTLWGISQGRPFTWGQLADANGIDWRSGQQYRLQPGTVLNLPYSGADAEGMSIMTGPK